MSHGIGVKSLFDHALTIATRGLTGMSARIGAGTELVGFLKLRYFDYRPRDTDVFLVTYPRSGTTWLQMMLHQLTSDGEMDIVHIADRIPWFERLPHSGKDIDALPEPRAFKSHLTYRKVPKGRFRYIYCCRDGGDVAVSYYHLRRSQFGYRGDFPAFFELFMRGKVPHGKWVDHVAGWWARRDDPNVLFVRYEDAVGNLPVFVQAIADFCGIETDRETLDRVVDRCSFEFMKRHEAVFDPAIEALWENGLTPDLSFRHGEAADGQLRLTLEQQSLLDGAVRDRLGVSLAALTDPRGEQAGSLRPAKDIGAAC